MKQTPSQALRKQRPLLPHRRSVTQLENHCESILDVGPGGYMQSGGKIWGYFPAFGHPSE